MEKNDQVSIDIGKLARSLRNEMEILQSLSEECCIYRVPMRLRQLNEIAYTPRVVSIGPLHHGNQEFKAMEDHKLRYLHDFLEWSKVNIEDCIKLVQKSEIRLRNCYAEILKFSSEDFVKMILLDATFIIVLLVKAFSTDSWSINDRIFNKPWLIVDIKRDMSLLENQLPFFILEELFKQSNMEDRLGFSIGELTYNLFKARYDPWLADDSWKRHDLSKVEHIMDFLRICQLPSKLKDRKKELKKLNVPSLGELHQAGVKFKSSSSKNLLDITFNNGILEIPPLTIGDHTEILLRNLSAFEQCHFKAGDYFVNDYICMMATIVRAPEDVEILVQSGIIENYLRNNESVLTLFHKLDQECIISTSCFYFSTVAEKLKEYSRDSWHKWKANLRQNYFNTPWAGISVFAAILLLMLTFIQSLCSILQVV
ncbi:UPF0481 protein At3g47200 [Manihot esculenta]|uniref:Uncharacterized protein n=2 Tax=Manihot esculenta TaxID=3983 RepID=A0A251KR02_MANES|nr:UPF0481 protein At3g47200 [Manihot esculenta]XP_021615029.1 UPF0481 protein At3g47200 [Manihot esculenta]XP_021615030.1 UPF0481 protein At3g47200 [Manihot esculenta]KAG8653106.1 hypothetical protein MANES_06G167400v8 [Manihot esculenta]OAY48563.1 hypothetical protein MANES_06G167400v8 [Manihot esculenta]OAY48564.1 hypothetical protein MANES_06G167400v8 [Manihot esculenta]OAY48565.1 hypothetical protein MANES_06G167400v8 [Manihot esculenta]OAY48566.1 hypothetical protein MANES_06G167400v8 